jgi:hypothetical protein
MFLNNVQVDFPFVGKLVTNRAGRVEFLFDPFFYEFFERESFTVIKEVRRVHDQLGQASSK